MKALRGLGVPAWLTGLARGVVEAVAFAIILALISWLQSDAIPEALGTWAPILVLVLRSFEGYADHIDSAKRREPGATEEG